MILTTFVATFLALLLIYANSTNLLSKHDIAKLYATYDVSDEHINYGECQDDINIEEQICPKNEKIGCSSLQEIRLYCREQIGEELAVKLEKEPKNTAKNAIEGCMKYIGYYVFDQEDHMACCESAYCEKWLDKKFDEMYPDDYYSGGDLTHEGEF